MLRYLPDVVTLELDVEACTGCGMCVTVCPHAVFVMDDADTRNAKARIVDRDACMECGACARNCASGAISVRAGVGCAAAVINGALGRADACCCE
jgi:ferredoxin